MSLEGVSDCYDGLALWREGLSDCYYGLGLSMSWAVGLAGDHETSLFEKKAL